MKVFHILDELKPSGAETMLHSAGPLWIARGIDLHVLSKGAAPGSYASNLTAAGYTVHHIPLGKPCSFIWNYVRLLSRESFDVVHVHTEHANFWLSLVARACGIARVVRTIHSVFAFKGALRFERKIQRLVLRKLGVTHVSIGKSVAVNERDVFGNPTVQVDNWYDSIRFVPPSPGQRVAARARWNIAPGDIAVVSVGNCSVVKNHEALLRALAMVGSNCSIVYLHAGEEPDHDERELASTLGIMERVRFLGFVDDVASLLHSADIYVMPSRHEGFGIAAVEAMAAGVPVLLSDVPGLRDLRSFGPEIVWVDALPSSIAEEIRTMAGLGDQARREIGFKLSRSVSERLSIERAVDSYMDVYRGLPHAMNSRSAPKVK